MNFVNDTEYCIDMRIHVLKIKTNRAIKASAHVDTIQVPSVQFPITKKMLEG